MTTKQKSVFSGFRSLFSSRKQNMEYISGSKEGLENSLRVVWAYWEALSSLGFQALRVPHSGIFQRFPKVDSDISLYIKSTPGMIEKIRRGIDASHSECTEMYITPEMLGLD